MSKLAKLIILLSSVVIISPVHAANSPFSLSILPAVQFPADDYSITGLRLSALWGSQKDIYGLDLGVLGNVTNGIHQGTSISGIFNLTRGQTSVIGAQLAGIINVNTAATRVYGLQAAIGMNLNIAEAFVYGLQVSLLNMSSHSKIYGVQLGIYNEAEAIYGFQIGLFNRVNNLHGMQIGLLNFNETGIFAFSPLVNIGF